MKAKKTKRPSRKGIAIKPYKGGRTKRFECRLTEAEEMIVNALVETSGLSKSDWLMAMAKPNNRVSGRVTTWRKIRVLVGGGSGSIHPPLTRTVRKRVANEEV